jgi:hypothetical protein
MKIFIIMIAILLTSITASQAQSWPGSIAISEVTQFSSNETDVNFSHNTTGEDRLLIVGISLETGEESKRVNSVTYSGVNLIRVGEVRGPSNDPRVDVWSLVNPPIGNASININLFEDNKIAVTAISFTGVSQSVPFSNVVTAGGSEGTPYLLVESGPGDLVIDFTASLADQISAGPSQIEISNIEIFDSGKYGGSSVEAGDSYVEMTWFGSEKWAAVGFSINSSGITDVNENSLIPDKIELMQNYPNPFNPATTISYSVPFNTFVILKVYDLLGNEIISLVNQEQSAGKYSIKFNSDGLSSGVYLYRFEAIPYSSDEKGLIETRRMILLK